MSLFNRRFTQVGTGDQIQLTGFPVVVRTGGREVILTAGSDLNRTAVGPWPDLIDTSKWRGGWNPFPKLREQRNVAVPANYGSRTSVANFGFRAREYNGVGNMPQSANTGHRPMWNNLVPIVWGLRDVDLKSQAQPGELVQQTVIQVGPSTFTPASVASLKETLL